MRQTAATRNSLRGILLLKGMSLSGWAKAHGYPVGLVTGMVSRFAGKEARPGRGISLEIIEALERDTGMKICG